MGLLLLLLMGSKGHMMLPWYLVDMTNIDSDVKVNFPLAPCSFQSNLQSDAFHLSKQNCAWPYAFCHQILNADKRKDDQVAHCKQITWG